MAKTTTWRAANSVVAVTLAASACCAVYAHETKAKEDAVEGPLDEAYASYMGYLNNVMPVFGAVLLFIVYFGLGSYDPAKAIKGPKVHVSHILVKQEEEADAIYKQIKGAKKKRNIFADLAAKKSSCPSKSKGGHMGVFGKGQMMPEFERIVFTEPVGSIHKVKTKFGWHVLMITERFEEHKKSQ